MGGVGMVRKSLKIKIVPLEKSLWKDFEMLFGEKGACGGCWCMYWRLSNKEFNLNKGIGNKELMKKLIWRNEPVGILGYMDGKVVGWCAIAPREKYIRLENSRVLEKVEGEKVWSISCFFVAKPYRRRGMTLELIEGAVKYAGKNGAKIVEGYPIDPKNKQMPDVFMCLGLYSAFKKSRFKEIIRRSPTRPIMRYEI